MVYELTLRHVTFSGHDIKPLRHSDIVSEGHLNGYVFMHCLWVGTNFYVNVEGIDSSENAGDKLIPIVS